MELNPSTTPPTSNPVSGCQANSCDRQLRDHSRIEEELLSTYRQVASAQRDLINQAQRLQALAPQDRAAHLLWAEALKAGGELDQAAREYNALLTDASPNERLFLKQSLHQCRPEPDDLGPAFRHYLDTASFGRPEHREYLLHDLPRGRQLVRLLRQWCPLRGRRVLDVGCSHGGAVMALAEQGAEVVGVEIDPRRSEVGRQRVLELGFQVEWHSGDICDATLVRQLGQFDLIICQDVLEHVMDPGLAIRHLVLLLRSGGIVYFVVPNKYSAEFILADHHWKLMGLSLLSRPQGLEYFQLATGIPAQKYDVGYFRTEKYYRQAFLRGGVSLQLVDRFESPDHVLSFVPAYSALATRLNQEIFPGLPPRLVKRIRRRAKKVVEIFIHASRVLKALENQPQELSVACDLIARRLGAGVWRFVGKKM
jgi:2-polyprenyl-3-methyl-5-hydroxy-6-metoxy-1,4-benzoquinol methylase